MPTHIQTVQLPQLATPESVASMILAAIMGEAPLSGVLNEFVKLTYTQRRRAGKLAKALVAEAGFKTEIGKRRYLYLSERVRLAVFAR